MNWEALSAVSALATMVVILVTVFVGRRQLDQLRRATQLQGAIAIFEELDSEEIDEARRFAMHELAGKLEDPQFRKEIEFITLVDTRVHRELVLLRFFERVGAYVDEGLVDGTIVVKAAFGRIMTSWSLLADVVGIHRSVVGTNVWQGFERLNERARDYARSLGVPVDVVPSTIEQMRRGRT
jgi:hypothetical protein